MRRFVVFGIFIFLGIFTISFASALWPFDYFKKSVTGNVVKDISYQNSATCADSDGGIYARIPGNVTYIRKSKAYNVSDRCLSKNEIAKYYRKNERNVQDMSVLTEWYCKNNRHISMIVQCDEGTICQDTPDGAACVSDPASFVDYSAFDLLPSKKKAQALKEARALDKKYKKYWEDIPKDKDFFSANNNISLDEYYSTLENYWEKQKRAYLDELALRKKHGVFYDDVDYDSYIADMNKAWDEQEKEQPWADPDLGLNKNLKKEDASDLFNINKNGEIKERKTKFEDDDMGLEDNMQDGNFLSDPHKVYTIIGLCGAIKATYTYKSPKIFKLGKTELEKPFYKKIYSLGLSYKQYSSLFTLESKDTVVCLIYKLYETKENYEMKQIKLTCPNKQKYNYYYSILSSRSHNQYNACITSKAGQSGESLRKREGKYITQNEFHFAQTMKHIGESRSMTCDDIISLNVYNGICPFYTVYVNDVVYGSDVKSKEEYKCHDTRSSEGEYNFKTISNVNCVDLLLVN